MAAKLHQTCVSPTRPCQMTFVKAWEVQPNNYPLSELPLKLIASSVSICDVVRIEGLTLTHSQCKVTYLSNTGCGKCRYSRLQNTSALDPINALTQFCVSNKLIHCLKTRGDSWLSCYMFSYTLNWNPHVMNCQKPHSTNENDECG